MTKTRLFFIAALAAAPFLVPAQAQARDNDRYCREYTKTVRIGGNVEAAYGTACMQPDGSWQLVSFGGDEDLFDDIARNSQRGNGRVVRVERQPIHYYYPLYERPYYRTHYHRQPVNVFSFSWRDDDDDRRHWKRDRDRHDRHDRHRSRHGRNRDRD